MKAAEQLATLSDTEAAELLALVRSHRAVSPEGKLEAEAAEYAAKIAEREAREAADPELQRQRKEASIEAQRRAEQELATELADLEAMAARDPRALAQPFIDAGHSDAFRCSQCGVQSFEAKLTGGLVLCGPHWAQHRLKCDACGAGKGIRSRLCADGSWRCDGCVDAYVADPTPPRLMVRFR
jgi:hypothetical protein